MLARRVAKWSLMTVDGSSKVRPARNFDIALGTIIGGGGTPFLRGGRGGSHGGIASRAATLPVS